MTSGFMARKITHMVNGPMLSRGKFEGNVPLYLVGSTSFDEKKDSVESS